MPACPAHREQASNNYARKCELDFSCLFHVYFFQGIACMKTNFIHSKRKIVDQFHPSILL
jgi:hypothetical protein